MIARLASDLGGTPEQWAAIAQQYREDLTAEIPTDEEVEIALREWWRELDTAGTELSRELSGPLATTDAAELRRTIVALIVDDYRPSCIFTALLYLEAP